MRKTTIKYLIFGLLLSLYPYLQKIGLISSSSVIISASVIFYAIAAIGLNVLLGYSGLISLGTAGFMGLSSYLSAYASENMNLGFIPSLLIAILIPLLISLILGAISLRLKGYYLAIATLAIGEILRQVFIEFEPLTNGFSGKNANYPNILGFQLDRSQTFVLLAITLTFILIFTNNFINSKTGRALLTMRLSEEAALAMGINIVKYKLIAFVIASIYTSIAGVLYVHFIRFSEPSGWNLLLSLQLLAVIVIGGMRTIEGPIIGSFIVFGVPELILKKLPIIGSIDGLAYMFTGLLIILTILFYPHGSIYLRYDIKKLFQRKSLCQKS